MKNQFRSPVSSVLPSPPTTPPPDFPAPQLPLSQNQGILGKLVSEGATQPLPVHPAYPPRPARGQEEQEEIDAQRSRHLLRRLALTGRVLCALALVAILALVFLLAFTASPIPLRIGPLGEEPTPTRVTCVHETLIKTANGFQTAISYVCP